MTSFIRINITAEGQTEESFVKQTLSTYLGNFNSIADVRSVLTSKDKWMEYRGGLLSYSKAKNDILSWMHEDKEKDVYFTTMFDLYGLPTDFPGYTESKIIQNPYEKVGFLESSFGQDIDDDRFIPYIQLHEFETLLLAKPEELELEYFNHTKAIQNLIEIVQKTGNPELVNDDPENAPSRQIIKHIPEYKNNKVSVGATIAGIIGIDYLKTRCRHFCE